MAPSQMRWGSVLVLAGAVTVAGCAGASPVSPSTVASVTGPGPGAGFSSSPTDAKDDAPPESATGDPITVTITIVGSLGVAAYDPNPATASVGDALVWTNNDRLRHHIILDDPNNDEVDDAVDLGIIAPGESSLPVSLTSATAQFHCTIHPSMKGGINEPPQTDVVPPPYDPYRARTSTP